MARGNGSQQPSGFPEDDRDGRCSELGDTTRTPCSCWWCWAPGRARHRHVLCGLWACPPSRAPGAFSRVRGAHALALPQPAGELTPAGHPRQRGTGPPSSAALPACCSLAVVGSRAPGGPTHSSSAPPAFAPPSHLGLHPALTRADPAETRGSRQVRHTVTAQSQTVTLTQALPLLAKGRENVRSAPLCSRSRTIEGSTCFFCLGLNRPEKAGIGAV